jgi:hypothetical protein
MEGLKLSTQLSIRAFVSIKIPNPYKKCMNFQQTKNLVLIATQSQPNSLSLSPSLSPSSPRSSSDSEDHSNYLFTHLYKTDVCTVHTTNRADNFAPQ